MQSCSSGEESLLVAYCLPIVVVCGGGEVLYSSSPPSRRIDETSSADEVPSNGRRPVLRGILSLSRKQLRPSDKLPLPDRGSLFYSRTLFSRAGAPLCPL